jgi:dihydroflavonol-4-reductase
MKIFITGATGFIGHHLACRLLQDGHELRCLVRDPKHAEELYNLGVTLVKGTVTDQAALREGMQGCDWLFHLANLYSMWEPDKGRFEQVNIRGTRCVLEIALEAGVKKVVYVSTVAVFGKPLVVPFTEECSPSKQLFSEYARTKAAGDQLAWELYHTRQLPLVVFYPGIVLGSGDHKASGQYIRDILYRRVPSTIFHQSRSVYVYVDDVVEALVRAAENPDTVGEKYLLGGHSLTGAEFARLISQVAGVPLPLLHFPDFLVIAAAYLLTTLSGLTRRPPWWGLSVDAAWTLKHGFSFDGSKAMRQLGIQYTPLDRAVEAAVHSYPPARPLFSNLCAAFLRIFHQEEEDGRRRQPGAGGEQEGGGVSTGVG